MGELCARKTREPGNSELKMTGKQIYAVLEKINSSLLPNCIMFD
jgi:hypothetical protein